MEYTSEQVADMLQERAAAFGVDPELAKRIFIAENSKAGEWNPQRKVRLDTRSSAGALGVMQVIPSTHAGLIKTGYLPASNRMSTLQEQLDAGLAAIQSMQHQIGTTDPQAVAVKYNASNEVYQQWIASGKNPAVLPAETQNYQKKVGNMQGTQLSSQAPAVPGISGTPLMQEFSSAGNQVMELLKAITGQSEADAASAKEALGRKASAEAGGIAAKTDAANADEAMKNKLLGRYSADVLQENSLASQAMQDHAVASQQLRILGPEMQKLEGIDPLSDPLGWFMGQIRLNSVAKQWDMAQKVQVQANSTMNNLQQRVAAQSSVQTANLADIRARGAAADIEASQAKASLEALNYSAQLRADKLNAAKVALSIGGDKVTQDMALRRLLQDDAHFQDSLSRRKDAHADLTRFNNKTAPYFVTPANSEADRKALGAEEEALAAALPEGVMGKDIGQIMRATELFGAMPKFQQEERTKAMGVFLAGVKVAAQAQLEAAARPGSADYETARKLSPSQRLEWASNKVWEDWKKQAATKGYDQLKDENPWKLQPYLAKDAPALKGNSVAEFVASRYSSGAAKVSEKDIFDYAAAEVTKGRSQEKVAQDVQAFFREGMIHQRTAMRFGEMGLDMSDPDPKNKSGESKYRVSVPGILGSSLRDMFYDKERDMNLFNLGDVQHLLVRAAKQQKAISSLGQYQDNFQLPDLPGATQ